MGLKKQTEDVRRFLEVLRAANPAGANLLDNNAGKATLAFSLRALRKARRLSREEFFSCAGMDLSFIETMESPLGPIPDLVEIEKPSNLTATDLQTFVAFV